jgi:hypothetical protein
MHDRLHHLFSVISGRRFLEKQGLGNEVPFFICPYNPEDSVEMERLRRQLVKQLESAGVRILQIDLYDLSVELLKERGIWDRILEMETSISKEELKELLQGVLDPEANLVPAIASRMAGADFDVLFISGVEEIFVHYLFPNSVPRPLLKK